ncbi:hypothetical protein D3C80_1606610 [compost metagenome]
MVHQVQVGAVEMVGEKRAAWATFAPAFGEHEVIHQQLAATGEQLGQSELAFRTLETIGLLDLDPGQGPTCSGQRVTLVGEGFFVQPQLATGGEPLAT